MMIIAGYKQKLRVLTIYKNHLGGNLSINIKLHVKNFGMVGERPATKKSLSNQLNTLKGVQSNPVNMDTEA